MTLKQFEKIVLNKVQVQRTEGDFITVPEVEMSNDEFNELITDGRFNKAGFDLVGNSCVFNVLGNIRVKVTIME